MIFGIKVLKVILSCPYELAHFELYACTFFFVAMLGCFCFPLSCMLAFFSMLPSAEYLHFLIESAKLHFK